MACSGTALLLVIGLPPALTEFICGFLMILRINSYYFSALTSISQLIFVMETRDVFFEARIKFLNAV
jgi:hypothetical protein